MSLASKINSLTIGASIVLCGSVVGNGKVHISGMIGTITRKPYGCYEGAGHLIDVDFGDHTSIQCPIELVSVIK